MRYNEELPFVFFPVALIAIIVCTLVSCSEADRQSREVYPKYSYTTKKEIPDSLRDDMAKWITETVSAASLHMSGGDYEDPEDLIEKTTEAAESLFERDVEGLHVLNNKDSYWVFIPYDKLTENQKVIFNDVKNGR